jgi:hypothetical protein
LLSYNEEEKKSYIWELKKRNNSETLLRCALEVYTYWKTVNCPKLLRDFSLPSDTELRKAPLVFKGCQAYRDSLEHDSAVVRLMRKLNIDFFVFEDESASIASHKQMDWNWNKNIHAAKRFFQGERVSGFEKT